MAKVVAQAVSLKNPGNSLAAWLAGHHPDVFLALYSKAKQAQAKSTARGIARRLGRLADDGVTTYFGNDSGGGLDTVTVTADTSTPPDYSQLTLAPTDSGLQTIAFDSSSFTPPADLLTDSPTDASGSSFLSSVGSAITSAGSTLGGVLSSAGSGVLSGIGAVGSFLSSSSGLSALTNVAKSYFTAQAANTQAAAQQAVVNAQIARAASGQPAAPITYTTNAAGQVVPVVATQTPAGTVYSPLTSSTLSSLTPSSLQVFLSQYGLWLVLGGLGLFLLAS